MKVVLLSTYDLGHQPFGLASPAAWLTEAGGRSAPPLPDAGRPVAETRVPRLSEPWYCCAEPTAEQLAGV